MAMIRIYDETVGQTAGVLVTTTGKGQIKNDGTEAFAQAVTNVDSSGTAVDLATEATLLDVLTALETPATALPPTPLMTTSDMLHGNVSRTGAGETEMVNQVSGQTTKLYMYALTVPGAGTVEIRDGTAGTVLRKHVFSAAGGIVLDFNSRPYAKTTANTDLTFYWSGSGEANIDFDYVTSA